MLDGLAERYGRPIWQRRLDPTSELILTILTQNSADTNAEVAFEALRQKYPGTGETRAHNPGPGWGGVGLPDGIAPDWAAVEDAPLPELVDTIRPGGLANQKAPRLQAALRTIREERGDHSLEFLGDLSALEAREWLTKIDGIGKKTASVLLLFSFGLPLMPVDRHVERVARTDRPRRPEGYRRRGARPLPGHARARPDVRGARQPHPARPRDLPRAPPRLLRLPGPPPLPLRRPQGALKARHPRSRRHPSGRSRVARCRSYTRAMFSGGPGGAPGRGAPRILLVDDDRGVLVPLAEQLRQDGFDVTTARDGEEALRRLDSAWPDLLIIDLLMPRMDGLTLAREIKARADLPIIVLSAIDAGDNKADLLDEFAEDYVTKPYHYSELRARIQRVLRRVGERVPRKGLVLGPDLVLELHRRQAIVGGETVALTPTESRLLYALAANLGKTLTTETLLARGWADTDEAEPSYVWVTMRRLRQKLEADPNRPRHLLTVRGVGYRLVAAEARQPTDTPDTTSTPDTTGTPDTTDAPGATDTAQAPGQSHPEPAASIDR